jgi:DNA-binding MarR family transcriptional regulator
MTDSFSHGPAREELLSVARGSSPAQELKCHALLELMETSQTLGHALTRELAHNELTENGFRVLALLMRHEKTAVSPGDVAGALHLRRSAISGVLGRLELSGLITRERNPADRRTLTLTLTQPGRQVFAKAVAHCLDSINRFMSVLPADEIAILEHACTRLRQSSTEPILSRN